MVSITFMVADGRTEQFVLDATQTLSEVLSILGAVFELDNTSHELVLNGKKLDLSTTVGNSGLVEGDLVVVSPVSVGLTDQQRNFLGRVQSGIKTRQRYENLQLQGKALSKIPIELLWEQVQNSLDSGKIKIPRQVDPERFCLLKKLVHWFKTDYFTWVNSPRCEFCKSTSTEMHSMGEPNQEDILYGAHRVELHKCKDCGQHTRFPRYNDPGRLLDSRAGRCGEWANCFCLCARAMGFEVRYISDWTDHVWAEVWVDHKSDVFGGSKGSWFHVDACEDSVDEPLKYEAGWGKKLNMIVAIGRDEVVDVITRYSRNLEAVFDRRKHDLGLERDWVSQNLENIDANMLSWNMQNITFDNFVRNRDERRLLEQRYLEELQIERVVETPRNESSEVEPKLKTGELIGRISGSETWKGERGEAGVQAVYSDNGNDVLALRGTLSVPVSSEASSKVVVKVLPFKIPNKKSTPPTLQVEMSNGGLKAALGCVGSDYFELILNGIPGEEPVVAKWTLRFNVD